MKNLIAAQLIAVAMTIVADDMAGETVKPTASFGGDNFPGQETTTVVVDSEIEESNENEVIEDEDDEDEEEYDDYNDDEDDDFYDEEDDEDLYDEEDDFENDEE